MTRTPTKKIISLALALLLAMALMVVVSGCGPDCEDACDDDVDLTACTACRIALPEGECVDVYCD